MPHYVTLVNFTDQGIRAVKDSRKRAEAFEHAAKEAGGAVKAILWTQGQYDMICVMEAPDDSVATTLLLNAYKLGNIRGQTLRAFAASEVGSILDKTI